jgi:hypothetical protein
MEKATALSIEVNTERGLIKYYLKETPGFIWLMTGNAATK